MPNRIIKESICTSPTIDALSPAAELFFYRLMVQCDDYGRMDARSAVLRARCYPLRLETVVEQDVAAWLDELVAADLARTYVVDGQTYLQVTKWEKHQQIRAKRSRYPNPQATADNGQGTTGTGYQLISDASNSPRDSESESESNSKPDSGAAAPAAAAEKAVEPLTEGQQQFLRAFGAQRFKTPLQREAVGTLEQVHGLPRLQECIAWASKRGMRLGDAIIAIENAIPNWGKSRAAKAAPGGNHGNSQLRPGSNAPDAAQLERDRRLKSERDTRARAGR